MDIIITWLSRVHQEDIVTYRQTAAASVFCTAIVQPVNSQRCLTCLDIVDMDLIISSTRGNKAAGCCQTLDPCLMGCMSERTFKLLKYREKCCGLL